MRKESLKKVLKSDFRDKNGRIDKDVLLKKVIALIMLLCGYHPDEAHTLKVTNFINHQEWKDRDGKERPKWLIANGITECKRYSYLFLTLFFKLFSNSNGFVTRIVSETTMFNRDKLFTLRS